MLGRFFLLLLLINTIVCVDYYELLGVQKNAENREIRKAFKKLALKYHPDKNNGKKDSNEKFIEINKAYEVLKDEEMRKNYDLYGEEGLKEDFGKAWKRTYHSWSYYHESFGIYDDDHEIITLSYSDFERLVLDSSDMWFVNFYSPQCSHCHLLAPSWRKLARELQGVIQIGAVNCEEDWTLCRQQNIYAYPSLMLYKSSKKTKYEGYREAEDLINYVLQKLPYNVIQLTSTNFKEEISSRQTKPLPWLIFSCERSECVSKDDLKKLGIILEHLVYVAEIVGHDSKLICSWVFCELQVTYYSNLSVTIEKSDLEKVVIVDDLEVTEIVNKVLHLLPELQEISNQKLEEIKNGYLNTNPWLIQFTKEAVSSAEKDIHMKRLKSFLPEINLGHLSCYNDNASCIALKISKFPSFVLFRQDGSYEFHYGPNSAYDISRFAHEVLKSQVLTLSFQQFSKVIQSEEIWFIDFFAPWCPPCIQFLSEFRKVSQNYDQSVKFGTVDCSVYPVLCRNYNIISYPSAILYKNSVGHKYHGLHSQNELDEFIKDVLNPIVVSLSPTSFQEAINNNIDDVWVVDFFAPWCGPCQQLAPQWRKLAKMLKNLPSVNVGEIDCQIYHSFCSSLGVHSYPTIRLFPRSSSSTSKFVTYNGWSRDATSLQAWVSNFLPSKVPVLSDIHFQSVLEDSKPWVIDFFAPWCIHCQTFAPKFEKIAQIMEGIVKVGKVNCDEFPRTCRSASINSYPTVVFYKGRTGSKPQSPIGEEINPFSFNDVISFLERKLNLNFKVSPVRDEL